MSGRRRDDEVPFLDEAYEGEHEDRDDGDDGSGGGGAHASDLNAMIQDTGRAAQGDYVGAVAVEDDDGLAPKRRRRRGRPRGS